MLNLGKYMAERPKGYRLRGETESPRGDTLISYSSQAAYSHLTPNSPSGSDRAPSDAASLLVPTEIG